MPPSQSLVPSGFTIQERQGPPGRSSPSAFGMVKPWGADQRMRCLGSVQHRNTRDTGASKVRTMVRSRAPAGAVALLLLAAMGLLLRGRLLRLQFFQVLVQAVQALLPVAAVLLHPVGHVFQGRCLQAAGAPLGVTAAADEPGLLQHLQVLGDGGLADLEGRGELGHRGLPRGEPRQDGPAGRIRQGGEGGAQLVGGHGYYTKWLINLMVKYTIKGSESSR